MRHPTTGLSQDDLSRLTGSSSSTASSDSCSSSSSSSSAENTPAHSDVGAIDCVHASHTDQKQSPENTNAFKNNNKKNSCSHHHQQRFSSTYLPELINPLEWQKSSRKRKERLDSSSSATQDRKLQRSNSEELLPQEPAAIINKESNESAVDSALKATKTADAVIRRVSSEDFKKTASYAASEQEFKKEAAANDSSNIAAVAEKREKALTAAIDENDGSLANRQQSQQQQQQQQQQQHDPSPPVYRDTWHTSIGSGPTKDMTRRSRYETSPARSQRFSPIRANGSNSSSSGKHRDSDDSECEHERRRSSERFCKTRLPPGRKAAGITKKSSSSGGGSGSSSASASANKYFSSKLNDENAYKYDLSALKYERRGFVSKKCCSASAEKTANDHNDNNLIDFHQQQQQRQQNKTTADSCNSSSIEGTTSSNSTSTSSTTSTPTPPTIKANNIRSTSSNINSSNSQFPITSAQEALPWDRSVPEDQAPVLSRRYAAVRHHIADSLDTAAKLSKVMPYPQQFHKQTAAQLYADDMDCVEPLSTFRAFTSLENLRTRDVMQQVIPAMMSFQTPDERLKQVNKRLNALKKKLTQLEEAYETRLGYRPSQAERLNDKYMKNVIAELNKLRKERHELKSDSMGALRLKVSGGMDATKKMKNIKTTLQEIEQGLTDKREDANRSDVLDELTPDQLVQEKSAVQHSLLYFESMYGRPTTKEERDTVRPLYERYRQLKRLVCRSVMASGITSAGISELPTILENEAMVFEATPQQYSSNNSTDTTNSPSEYSAVAANCGGGGGASSDDSTTTTTGANATTQTSTTSTTTATTVVMAGAAGLQPATSHSNNNENICELGLDQLWEHLDKIREEKKLLKYTIREFETIFEEQNGRKMLKSDRKTIEETYAQYKEKKAKTRLLQELIKKQKRRVNNKN